MGNIDNDQENLDALCKECGYAFKAYVDRILPAEQTNVEDPKIECPVCGCTKCTIGK